MLGAQPILQYVAVVIIAWPNHLRAPLTIQALETGKHVLVEKPIAHNSTQAQAMIEARERTGKTLMVGMNQRFRPGQAALTKRIHPSVEFGNPLKAQ